MSKISNLKWAVTELTKLIQRAESKRAFTPEYIRGYLHLAELIIAWCNRNEEIEPNTVAPKGKAS